MKRFHFFQIPGIRLAAAAGLVLACAVWLLRTPQTAAQGVSQGAAICLNTLVPSLFPFMVLSTYIAESGLASSLGRFVQTVTRLLFRQPGCTLPVVLLGLVGGYPAGAKAAARLYEKGEITREQAGRLLCFCVSAGPPFVLTAVAACLLGNPSAGAPLLLSVTGAALLLGIFTRFGAPVPEKKPRTPNLDSLPSTSPFVASVRQAGAAMALMCAFVMIFWALLFLIQESGFMGAFTRQLMKWGLSPASAAALPAFLSEVTAGCRTGAAVNASLPLFAFGLGWGGLCVHLQIFSLFREFPLSRLRFFLFRFLHGLLSGGICWLILPLFPESAAASALWSTSAIQVSTVSVPAAIVLFLLLLIMALDGSKIGSADSFKKKCPREQN